MAFYEHRKGGQVVERVRTVPKSLEDTRIGLQAMAREKAREADGWYLVEEPAALAPADEQPEDTNGGG
ncbi:hypothetical protein ACOQFV_27330 [Nocardiopsis changdeensis]|uniref:SPOR domain-containing protein n=1 Tax=Nocardiopsis changdeensis TaxID=2831969 RepID=A0ABX8BLC4_9ACTN|nr:MULTISPECIES: hypothetical protein [Nocardiopsis]QUX22981.1 hypothetical protein KGD84_00790 [Nocardiopsis changdeensis]QYX38924.1 hypothetical protein K1J57_10240 [Nocardiopsis sp. MT53]